MATRTIDSLEHVEALLWRTLLQFETLAQAQYRAHAPDLLCDPKTAFIERLSARAGPPTQLADSPIGAPVGRVLALAEGPDTTATLTIQGLLLEPLGQVIYGVPPLLTRHVGDSDALLAAFERSTPAVIRELDVLGEGVDEAFAETLNLHFSDVMGEFAADLLERCMALGMPRRRLIVFLTGQMMGI